MTTATVEAGYLTSAHVGIAVAFQDGLVLVTGVIRHIEYRQSVATNEPTVEVTVARGETRERCRLPLDTPVELSSEVPA